MNDRFNTIAGWVLAGGIVLLGGTLVAGEFFEHGRPEKMGYPIAGVVEEGAGGGGEAEQPIAALLATADVARGEAQFRKCAACHTVNQGGANGVGPNLWGVLGGPHGHRPDFTYSDALKSKPGNWDWESMSQWLRSPRAYAPGTKMTFAGLSNAQDRADLILYLNSQGSNLPLPPPPAAGAAEGNAAAPAEGNAAAAAENASAAVPGRATDQPVLNSAQGGGQPKGGGEAAPQPGGH